MYKHKDPDTFPAARGQDDATKKRDPMSASAKVLLLGVLIGVVLGATTFAAVRTYQVYQRLHQYSLKVQARDAQIIRAWMTLPYIARVYHVPEDYLYQWLGLQNTPPLHHATLYAVAERLHQPVEQVITSVQHAFTSLTLPLVVAGRSLLRSPPPTPRRLPFHWQNAGGVHEWPGRYAGAVQRGELPLAEWGWCP